MNLLRKNDWIFSALISIILIMMILSNIGFIDLLMNMKVLYMFIYVAMIVVVLLTMTHISIHQMGYRVVSKSNWIQNHLIFWIMADLHTIIMIARYVIPFERTGGLLSELFLLIHLFMMIPVYFSYKSTFYQKHEVGLSFSLHVIIYTLISFSFIQLMFQIMQ